MQIRQDITQPIFLQIAQGIEDAILSNAYKEEEQIPSITEFSTTYKINPATALKGINILVDSNIIYKKRGLGMFVTTGAKKILKDKRKEQFFKTYIEQMLEEAKRLDIGLEEIKAMIERGGLR